MLCILDRHDSLDSECDGTMKPYKEKNHTNPDPINIICLISLIHFISFLRLSLLTIEIRRGGNHPPKKATGLFPVALIDLLCLEFLSNEIFN
jgi:hypothetical protein